jgi:muramoyltetrapeptide carboxypeptidase
MEKIKPQKLNPGDEIRIIAPASAPDIKQLSEGVSRLRKLGFKVSVGRNIKKLVQRNDLAAPSKERSEELMAAFKDPNVKAIFCARGGYGSIHILPLLDYDLIKDNPKIFMGYSDITALHLAMNKFSNLITFHGPMVASDVSEFSKPTFKYFLDILSGKSTDISMMNKDRLIKYIIPGKAEGLSMGTNLSVAASLFGTSYLPDTGGRIFFIEDTNITSGDIDRYFYTMKLANLNNFSGYVFGDFKAIMDKDEPTPSVEDVVQKFMNETNKPSLYGAPFGHGEEQLLIPLNAMIEISDDDPYMILKEDIVN